jgi:hypothetical protein
MPFWVRFVVEALCMDLAFKWGLREACNTGRDFADLCCIVLLSRGWPGMVGRFQRSRGIPAERGSASADLSTRTEDSTSAS